MILEIDTLDKFIDAQLIPYKLTCIIHEIPGLTHEHFTKSNVKYIVSEFEYSKEFMLMVNIHSTQLELHKDITIEDCKMLLNSGKKWKNIVLAHDHTDHSQCGNTDIHLYIQKILKSQSWNLCNVYNADILPSDFKVNKVEIFNDANLDPLFENPYINKLILARNCKYTLTEKSFNHSYKDISYI